MGQDQSDIHHGSILQVGKLVPQDCFHYYCSTYRTGTVHPVPQKSLLQSLGLHSNHADIRTELL